MFSHYTPYTQSGTLLREWAAWAEQIINTVEYPVLIYSGMSGTAFATALAVHSKKIVGMVYVRKQYESSHGEDIEYSLPWLCVREEQYHYFFVDDFISTGATLNWVIESMRARDYTVDHNNVSLLLKDIGGTGEAMPDFELYEQNSYKEYIMRSSLGESQASS